MLQLQNCPPIEYIRRPRQRNIRIRVKSDRIMVSGPWYCSHKAMSDFVSERRDWIENAVKNLNFRQNHHQSLLANQSDKILLRGQWIPMMLRHSIPESEDWKLIEREGRVDVYPPANVIVNSVAEVPSEVKREYLFETARIELPLRFKAIASQLPFKWNRIFIRSQKTKWGTCSSKRNISLNWRLIMCPPHILEYLIIHELCHTVHMNHSRAYWDLVRSHYPEVDAANMWLKKQGNICFLV